MEPEIKKITTNYDGIAKSLLDSMKDESLVDFINSSFSKNFKKDSKVVRLATETYDEELKQKRCDYFIRIENDLFLIEIQSNDDSEMAMRIFDYGIRGAKIHGSVKNDEIIDLKLPEPVVFFLRKNNPKEKLSVRISGPNENDSFT
ncbi:MAG: Rpn family recombination-promoting nuclease/putative transposase, partial [Oscillospiraceae bacterium]|nr:Rpn family recombination-promoting nuclease/putative transposase [Oscillospiraceae bacterium]